MCGERCGRRIDYFLIRREDSVLKKLVAIAGAAEEEGFEVQVKACLASPDTALRAFERGHHPLSAAEPLKRLGARTRR